MARRISIRTLKHEALQTLHEANRTLNQGQQTLAEANRSIVQLTAQASAALVSALELLESAQDGIGIELEIGGKAVPVRIKILLDE